MQYSDLLSTSMNKFEFHSVSRIVFGRGQFSRIGDLAKELACERALVVSNSSAQLNDALQERLKSAGIKSTIIGQRGEPTVDQIDAALMTAREAHCDMAIGIGGGSAIDAAKAVAGLLTNGGAALDYMEVVGKGQKITRPAAPWIAVPCTAGTGAEATRNAVIGYPAKNFKASLRSEHLLPRIALIDPELAINVRPEITARTGMDALCQCIEAYTSTGANPMTDALALEGITRAGRSLQMAFTDGSNLDAREDLAMAALLSGIALTNAGLGAVHGFAAPLGASFPIPHGTACAVLLPGVMSANVTALRAQNPQHPTLSRYATVSRALMNDPSSRSDQAIEAAIRFTTQLRAALKIEPLTHFNFKKNDIPTIVQLAKKASSMRFNPVVLSDEALSAILSEAMDL